MFENYIATKADLEAIKSAVRLVWNPELNFIFRERTRIKNTVIVSYDSKFLYLWSKKENSKKYSFEKVPHNISMKDEWQYAWRVGFLDRKIEDLLPEKLKKKSSFEMPKISGGLLTPFTKLQKHGWLKFNPYTTYDSYVATIVHEFAHIYWNSYKMWWPSDLKRNLLYMEMAKKAYSDKKIPEVTMNFPAPSFFGEIFAFCAEYHTSKIFLPAHKKSLDNFTRKKIKEMIENEKKKDLEKEDSVIEPTTNVHDFAFVFGKLILNKYPRSWSTLLTQVSGLSTQF